MTPELTKQLKDAGFPPLEWEVATPTLSELIEACGGMFASLNKHYGQIGATNHKTPWWAAKSITMDEGRVGEIGSTPEIAVARLWLALKGVPTHPINKSL